MFNIIKSLIWIILISGIVSTVTFICFGTDILGVFTLCTILQLILGYIINTVLDSKEKQATILANRDIISTIEETAVEAPCAYCDHINIIPIITGEQNDFECIKCGNSNSVYVNITIAQKTVPIDSLPFEVTSINPGLDRARQSITKDE